MIVSFGAEDHINVQCNHILDLATYCVHYPVNNSVLIRLHTILPPELGHIAKDTQIKVS